jgi:23S rRNA (adenine2503-C2)-methyltransferase
MTQASVEERTELLGLTKDEVCEFMIARGEKPYGLGNSTTLIGGGSQLRRNDRVAKDAASSSEDHSVATRTRIDTEFLSSDGTRRFCGWPMRPEVESVFMPEERRDTICISSRVGCPWPARMTGVLGLKRNLSAGRDRRRSSSF